ncbi:hypothetical protein Fmac_002114 [Flemingia macrophylla]|uniref:Uncharacterized protein n=1 Tax=Flemingia macrophylla TaxID=520843 RepID=A0ABD1NJ02_9FABA
MKDNVRSLRAEFVELKGEGETIVDYVARLTSWRSSTQTMMKRMMKRWSEGKFWDGLYSKNNLESEEGPSEKAQHTSEIGTMSCKLGDSLSLNNKTNQLLSPHPPLETSVVKMVASELRVQRGIVLPMVAMNLAWFGKTTITTAFLDRLRDLSLAGGALSFTFANVTGFSLLNGLCDAMGPICGQAHGATKTLGSFTRLFS